jgi:hypothetical protein
MLSARLVVVTRRVTRGTELDALDRRLLVQGLEMLAEVARIGEAVDAGRIPEHAAVAQMRTAGVIAAVFGEGGERLTVGARPADALARFQRFAEAPSAAEAGWVEERFAHLADRVRDALGSAGEIVHR